MNQGLQKETVHAKTKKVAMVEIDLGSLGQQEYQ